MKVCRLSKLDELQGKQMPLPQAQTLIQEVAAQIEASSASSSEEVQALLEDLTGQVAEAFSREDWFTKWGVHFLPSLVCAHAAQQCNNFKDPGVQQYGGDLFQNLRDEADDTFLHLPAP